jgi:hypothetical protein
MPEITYAVQGFLTVRKRALRVPLSGSLALNADLDSGTFTGDLVLQPSVINRTVFGARIFSATVQIMAEAPVTGRTGQEAGLLATVQVGAVISAVRIADWNVICGDSCRTSTHATVPLRSQPGVRLDEGGRLTGTYDRPPFTGCGWITPLVNLLIAGPGNSVVIDLLPAHPPRAS